MPSYLRPETLDFVERAPTVIRVELRIPATPAQVWPAFAEASAWPEWFSGLKVARYTSPPPWGVGTKRHVEVKGLVVDETLIAFDPERCYAFRVDTANLPILSALVEVITLEPAGDSTRVVYRQAFEFPWWLRPIVGLFRGQMEQGLRDGLAGLAPWVSARSTD